MSNDEVLVVWMDGEASPAGYLFKRDTGAIARLAEIGSPRNAICEARSRPPYPTQGQPEPAKSASSDRLALI